MRRLSLLLLALLVALPAAAHSFKAGNVLIGHPWAKPTQTRDTEVYLSLLNRAAEADQLVGVIVPLARAVDVIDDAGRRITVVDLPPGRPFSLKPGGVRIRLVDLDRPLRVGSKLKLTLIFARAGSVAIEALVEAGPTHS
jgi:copper(I)-binding protein